MQGNCQGSNCPSWEMSRGAIILGGNCLEAIAFGGNCPGGTVLAGAIFQGVIVLELLERCICVLECRS